MVGGGGPGLRRCGGRRWGGVGEIEMRLVGGGGGEADRSVVSCDSAALLRCYLSFKEALWWPDV